MGSRAVMNMAKSYSQTLLVCTLDVDLDYFLPDFSDFRRSIWSGIKALSGKTTTTACSVVSS